MAIKNINNDPNRPFVPSTSDDTSSSDTSDTILLEFDKKLNNSTVLDDGLVKNTNNTSNSIVASEKYAQYQNEALLSLVNDDSYYEGNILSNYQNPTYRFKLYMTTETELIVSAGSPDISSLYAALDNLPKIVIAESGVTAGFNISEVEIDSNAGPGFRNRSAQLSAIRITITEGIGSSLIESIATAAHELDIQNFAKFYFFLELSFIAYNEDGTINYNPCSDLNLMNGGRWIYQISINNMDVNINETGSTYVLTCVPMPTGAFNEEECGVTPETMSVTGATIGEFCENLVETLTKKWSRRYAGEIYKFGISHKSIKGIDKDPTKFKLKQNEVDPQNNISFDENAGAVPVVNIPKGSKIHDIITFLYSNCEEAQKLMLDTSSPENVEDENGKFNGKDHRVAIIPYIEPDVKITGFDPITGNYMKEINYRVWGYKSFNSNLSQSQYENVLKDKNVAVNILKDLRSNNYLKKKYHYRYTGLNTEVLNFDLDFNFAFSVVLPSMSGWRNSYDSVVDHAKANPAVRPTNGDSSFDDTSYKNDVSMYSQINRELTDLSKKIDDAKDRLQYTTDQAEKESLSRNIAHWEGLQNTYSDQAGRLRSDYNNEHKQLVEELSRNRKKITYAEDEITTSKPFRFNYRQSTDDNLIQAGFSRQVHRGASLVGALLDQTYAPITSSLATIDLTIRGDPYWLGYSTLEGRAMFYNPALDDKKDNRPNFLEGDSTFAVLVKFASSIGDDGRPVVRETDMFNGIYRAATIKSTFSNGEFKQVIRGNKLELLAITNTGSKPSKGQLGTN